jgi:hypothetical protein
VPLGRAGGGGHRRGQKGSGRFLLAGQKGVWPFFVSFWHVLGGGDNHTL